MHIISRFYINWKADRQVDKFLKFNFYPEVEYSKKFLLSKAILFYWKNELPFDELVERGMNLGFEKDTFCAMFHAFFKEEDIEKVYGKKDIIDWLFPPKPEIEEPFEYEEIETDEEYIKIIDSSDISQRQKAAFVDDEISRQCDWGRKLYNREIRNLFTMMGTMGLFMIVVFALEHIPFYFIILPSVIVGCILFWIREYTLGKKFLKEMEESACLRKVPSKRQLNEKG